MTEIQLPELKQLVIEVQKYIIQENKKTSEKSHHNSYKKLRHG